MEHPRRRRHPPNDGGGGTGDVGRDEDDDERRILEEVECWNRLVRSAIVSSLHSALGRLCGGGVVGPGHRHGAAVTCRTGDVDDPSGDSAAGGVEGDDDVRRCRCPSWGEELMRLAEGGVSFPNGGRVERPRRPPHDLAAAEDEEGGRGGIVGGKPHDVEIRAALTLFHRYKSGGGCGGPTGVERGGKRGCRRHGTDRDRELGSSPQFYLEVKSDLGLVRRVDSAVSLASKIALYMEEDRDAVGASAWDDGVLHQNHPKRRRDFDYPKSTTIDGVPNHHRHRGLAGICDDIRVDRSGVICLVTKARAVSLRRSGRLPCPLCTTWCRGEKGLWWHQQQQHSRHHSAATTAASSQVDHMAIVPYVASSNLTPSFREDNATPHNVIEKPTQESEGLEMVKKGDIDGLVEAIKRGFDPCTFLDKNGSSALHWAAGSGHLDVVTYLVEGCGCPADVGQRGRRSFSGRTALHWAARNGHLPVVRYLVDSCRVDLDATTVDGTTAFCWACWRGHLPVMRFLHGRGCDVDRVNSFGCNPVLWNAQGTGDNSLDSMRWLHSVGCDFGLVNANGHGALHKAAQRGKHSVARWLLRPAVGDEGSDGDEEASHDDTEPPSHIVDWDLSHVAPDGEGCSPSDLAGMEGHHELASWLSAQERALAVRHWRRRRADAAEVWTNVKTSGAGGIDGARCSPFPSWLVEQIHTSEAGGDVHRLCNERALADLWEAWGGARRMASAILAEEKRKDVST